MERHYALEKGYIVKYTNSNYEQVKEFNILELIKCSNDKEQLEKLRKRFVANRSKEEKKDKILFRLRYLKKDEVDGAYTEWRKKNVLESIASDFDSLGEDGEAIKHKALQVLKDQPYDVLQEWSRNSIEITNRDFDESISTTSHICSRATNITANLTLGDKKFIVKGMIFHEAFRV